MPTDTAQNLDRVKPISYEVNDKNHITVGGVDSLELIKQYGSPLYVMCEETIRKRAQAYENAFKKYHPNHLTVFASKSFNCQAICKLMEQEGLGLDVVSGGELYTAISAGFPADKIIFHGNNKPYDELEMAIENEIYAIMLDNFTELDMIQAIIDSGKVAKKKINLMIRITPGIECHTHEYIKTGKLDSKFGFNIDDLETVINRIQKIQKSHSETHIRGLHAHIGSQIFETVPHHDTAEVLVKLYKEIKEKFDIEFESLNIGGGLGIKYLESDDPPSIDSWVKVVCESIQKFCKEHSVKEPCIMVEPGRSLVGPAGLTLYKVGNIKDIPGIRKYVAVDGGMADNARPIMYQADYQAQVANKAKDAESELVTIAGRYCESGDILIKDIKLAATKTGDFIAIYSTGAYNYSMASNYNRTTKPAVVLVRDGKSEIIVKRESYEDLVRLDKIPSTWK